jgi:hypothetical protein
MNGVEIRVWGSDCEASAIAPGDRAECGSLTHGGDSLRSALAPDSEMGAHGGDCAGCALTRSWEHPIQKDKPVLTESFGWKMHKISR